MTVRRSPILAALALALLLAALLAGCGSSGSSSSSSSGASTGSSTPSASASTPATTSGQIGFEGVPIETGTALASPSTTQTGTVDGISCGATEQLAYHIHAHLAVYVSGTLRALPAGIGIPGSRTVQTSLGPVAAGGSCIYWLHTHAPDGIIHVESPTQRVYTLGNFFDEWHQPLSAHQVAGVSGKLTAFVDGKAWTGDPRAIPLSPHAVIQIDVGSPATLFKSLSWAGLRL